MVADIAPQLLIIDSLSPISSKGENSIEDVRTVLGFLNLLAQDYHLGLLLIHYLRKAGDLQGRVWDLSIDDFRGSSHIIAMARSVLGLSLVQTEAAYDRNGPRKLEVIKTNLGPYPEPLGFQFVPLHPAGVALKWGSAPTPYHEPSKADECRTWLAGQLIDAGDAGLRPAEIVERGADQGFSRAMIYRARDELGASITNTHGRKHPENAWKWTSPGT